MKKITMVVKRSTPSDFVKNFFSKNIEPEENKKHHLPKIFFEGEKNQKISPPKIFEKENVVFISSEANMTHTCCITICWWKIVFVNCVTKNTRTVFLFYPKST